MDVLTFLAVLLLLALLAVIVAPCISAGLGIANCAVKRAEALALTAGIVVASVLA